MLTARWLFLSSALLLPLFANVAFGNGMYQHTKDGKTLVWNNDPKTNDEATWSGGRDGEGYASGFGTLTWHTGHEQTIRHLGIPFTKSDVYARYFGNMVHGKFNGPVNVHSLGKTDHAIFVDGVRTTRWAAGPAPSRAGAQERVAENAERPTNGSAARTNSESVREQAAQRPTPKALPPRPAPEQPVAEANQKSEDREQKSEQRAENSDRKVARTIAKEEKTQLSTLNPQQQAEAPAEGPSAAQSVAKSENAERPTNGSAARTNSESVREQAAQRPIEDTPEAAAPAEAPSTEKTSDVRDQTSKVSGQRSTAEERKAEVKGSLLSLVEPPSALHINPAADASPGTNARLTKEEVVDLADAEARSRGYHPAEYQRLDPQYNSADEIWSISYGQRSVDETAETAKDFSVIVDDKTKGTVFVAGKSRLR